MKILNHRSSSAYLALWIATASMEGTNAFAPPLPRASMKVNQKNNILQRNMVMDNLNPLGEILSDTPELTMDEGNKKKLAQGVSTDPTPVFVSFLQDFTTDKQMKAAAAAMALALAFLPLPSDAAMSGGRMGGSFSAPRQSMSRPAPSRSYSSGYSRGYSSGYSSRPSVVVAPTLGYGYSPFGYNPLMAPGYYGGPGVISYSRGPNLFSLFIVGGMMFALVNAFRNAGSSLSSSTMDMFDTAAVSSALGSGTSVAQISVALEVPNRDDPNSILNVLNRLANTAKTDSRVGIQNLTSQVALELLRRKSSIVSASSTYKHYGDRTKAGREFQSMSVKERSKFEKETVSKYGGVDYSIGQSKQSSSGMDGKATMAVVTLVVAIDGDSTKMPRINSISDVEDALRRIASDSKVDDCLQSAEILWTPEDRSESVSLRDVIADYPELRSV